MNRDAALDLAALGLAVFPVWPRSKVPATKHGFRDATTNPETVRRLWRQDRNIGVATGAASGIWVLDVDGERGRHALHDLEARHGPLPATVSVESGGGGLHLWWRYTGPIQGSTGRVAPGVEVKGDGGCITAPPSIHRNGRPYRWVTPYSADRLASAPEWLVMLTRPKPATISEQALATIRRPRGGANRGDRYGLAALDREAAALASVAPGARNTATNLAAFRLFQLVAGGELEADRVVAGLLDACHRNGLIADDGLPSVIATIRSGARAGRQYPRQRRDGAA